MEYPLLLKLVLLLLAAVVVVPLFQRAKLGAVLGYLAAGMLVGPWAFGIVTNAEATLHYAEAGVVLLLFLIGLELEPSRLWALRRPIFGLGTAQMALSAVAIGALAWAAGMSVKAAALTGLALSLSSTALVLASLAERGELTHRHGRESFAILLFQDLAVIPLLALLPLFGSDRLEAPPSWLTVTKALVTIGVVVIIGRRAIRPLLKALATHANREVFTAAALLLVAGSAWATTQIGLSPALGAFLAGVLLADSEFRHELEADIEPFKGLLLGLFFMAVGMSANLGLLAERPLDLIGAALALMAVKTMVLYAIARFDGAPNASAQRLGVALAQGGEFAFVLFGAAVVHRALTEPVADFLIMVVTVSLVLAPLAMRGHARLLDRWSERRASPIYDTIDVPDNPVIVAGFGRFGQMVCRVLQASGIPFTALEANSEQVDGVRRFGNRIYYGDASRLELLHSAGAAKARLFVLAVDDMEKSVQIAELVRRHFPRLKIIARARNRVHVFRLRDAGVTEIVRETFASGLEAATASLIALGRAPEDAARAVELFRQHDEELMERQYGVHEDEDELVQSSRQAAQQIREVFEQDYTEQTRRQRRERGKPVAGDDQSQD
ncbi:MAG: monovalent cation:proton antiporter-2 (CPA2) family protein [Burkholderiales bacterium]